MGALAIRLLDDIVRIVEAEVKLLEVDFSTALTAALDRAVGRFLGSLFVLIGGGCLLAGLIMLLHEWLPIWQALAITGGSAIAIGFIIAWMSGRIAKKAEKKLVQG